MRQTLFYIPHELFGLPVLGVGWALIAWFLFGAVVLALSYRRHGWTAETYGYLPILAVVAAAIVFVLPQLEVGLPGQEPFGLPIRGYGTLMLAGVLAGVGLSVRRARQVGLDADTLYSLAFWMVVVGIPSARLFFVIEYWDEFQAATIAATIRNIVMYTEGGLVVYGSVIGVVIALYVFSRKRRIAPLKLADVIAPGMVLGLALGRLGCLMNGCCYGGICDTSFGITFPQYASNELRTYSPPYGHQLDHGMLHGMRLEQTDEGVAVRDVVLGGPAHTAGLEKGLIVLRLNGRLIETLKDAAQVLREALGVIEVSGRDGRVIAWRVGKLPRRSLPVHPTQIYSAINAALLCVLLCAATPHCTRQGQIFALMIVLYAITRSLLEIIRTDEGGQFGTALTISQWISVFTLVGGSALLKYVSRHGTRINGAVE